MKSKKYVLLAGCLLLVVLMASVSLAQTCQDQVAAYWECVWGPRPNSELY